MKAEKEALAKMVAAGKQTELGELDGVEHIGALMALGKERAAQEFEAVRERFLDDVVAPYTPFDSASRAPLAGETPSVVKPGRSPGAAHDLFLGRDLRA